MKKILTVSVLAMMAVTAANAEIASKAYVNQEDNAVKAMIGTLSELDTTAKDDVVTAINELVDSLGDSSDGLADRLDVLEGDASTSGSVAKSIADALQNYTTTGNDTNYVKTVTTTGDGNVVSGVSANDNGTVTVSKSITALQASDIVSGSTAGAISVAGSPVSVYGLGDAAYENVADTYSASSEAPISGKGVAAAITGLDLANTYETKGTAAGLVGDTTGWAAAYGNDVDTVSEAIAAVATTADGAVQESDVQDTYSASSEAPISGKGVAAAITGLSLGTMAQETASNYTKTADLDSSTSATSGQVVTAISMDNGVLSQTTADPLSVTNYTKQTVNQGAGKYALTAIADGNNNITGYAWELIERASGN